MDSLDSFVTKTKDLLELEREAELEETRYIYIHELPTYMYIFPK